MVNSVASRPSRPRSARTTQVDELVTAVLTASRVLVGVSAASLAEIEDTVTVTQFRTLVVLDSRGGTNLNGLADALGVNASTAVRMVDRLFAAGLVSRTDNPANRREVVLELTRAGAELVSQEIARIVRRMPVAQRAELVEALTTFADAAGEPYAHAGAGPGW